MNMKTVAFAAAIAVGASVTAANATLIDFTDRDVWTTGTFSADYGDFTVTLSSSGGDINFTQNFDGIKPIGSPLAFDSDGLGVDDDEISALGISSGQTVTLSFSKAIRVTEVFFLDLFRVDGSRFESALVDFGADGSIDLSFAAVENFGGGAPGYLASTAGLPSPFMTKLSFTIFGLNPGSNTEPGNDGLGVADFALAGVRVEVIPVPAAGFLLLGGLGALAAVKRRKKA